MFVTVNMCLELAVGGEQFVTHWTPVFFCVVMHDLVDTRGIFTLLSSSIFPQYCSELYNYNIRNDYTAHRPPKRATTP